MKIVRSLEETNWRRFVQEHPEGNIFHTPEMFQVFARTPGHRPQLWAAIGDDDQALALLLPVHITLRDGLLRRLTTRAVAYGSVLHAPGPAGQEALTLLLRACAQETKREALFTELRNLSDLRAVQPVLQDCAFVYQDHLNYLIDLRGSPEEVMQNIGKRTRKKIRQALRQGDVTIEEADRPEQVAICYELLQRSYAVAQVPLADRAMFQATFDVLHPKGMVKFLLARVGNVYAASSVELVYKDTIYGWYGGMDRDYSDYIPNELLLWYLFEWGATNGYRIYDFGGAGKPDEAYGVRDFKAKFGGELVCYGRNTCVHSPRLIWLSERGYKLLRRWL